jgi:hypothetical protein
MLVSDLGGRLRVEPVQVEGETLVELCQSAQASDGSQQLGSKILSNVVVNGKLH